MSESGGWQQIRPSLGQFRKMGAPAMSRINAIGFMNATQETRGYIIDSIRVID